MRGEASAPHLNRAKPVPYGAGNALVPDTSDFAVGFLFGCDGGFINRRGIIQNQQSLRCRARASQVWDALSPAPVTVPVLYLTLTVETSNPTRKIRENKLQKSPTADFSGPGDGSGVTVPLTAI